MQYTAPNDVYVTYVIYVNVRDNLFNKLSVQQTKAKLSHCQVKKSLKICEIVDNYDHELISVSTKVLPL